MKVLIYILIILGIFVSGVYIYGLTLPSVRTGTASKECQAPVRVLLATILDVESQPKWRKNVASVQRSNEVNMWVEKTRQREEITFTLVETKQHLVSMLFASTYGYFGTWRAEVTEYSKNISVINATEEVSINSPFGRVISRLFFNPEKFAASYLRELCSEAEKRAVTSN